jgi:predicted RNA binding protein YcfA (HicA-like mRNA interferase family)
MAKLTLISAEQLSKVIQKLGFKFIRQEGRHMFFRHDDGGKSI